MKKGICNTPGCGRETKAHGLCLMHYKRLWRAGALPERITPAEKLAKHSKLNIDTGCIEWTGIKSGGYGRLRVDNRNQYAHRVAWELANGKIPDDLKVLHKCDNPGCINPEHLFIGTQADNVADMHVKGRQRKAKGSEHGFAKLTENEVIAIFHDQRPLKEIAAEFGISFSCIGSIKSRGSWKHVPLPNMGKRKNRLIKLTDDKVKEIRNDPRPLRVIAKDYGVTFAHVGVIKRGILWKHVSEVENA